MRIAFFDGILETHVPDSLERALIKRGHTVLNRGKFGHGFKFPRPGQNTGRIHAEIDAILAFSPDVILVFRPALLPPEIMPRLKNRGITLIAWFSDDPVLFDLSYGPVVEDYDVILHCGNSQVLEYYEHIFGTPTGVNFPFWTDHESFPRLWKPEGFLSDAVFLGNVQDEVRRQRYFELAQMQNTIRIHGNVGTDYFGVWGGFLDTDSEVAHSIAKSRVAINIPQFFKDHYGQETWFPDLDKLGFFEFPSRVIQYMAVGVPTVTLLPSAYEFESYPEMLVFQKVEEVDEYLNSVSLTELENLSHKISSRFQRHFSADSRALALESIIVDHTWRQLDANERALWFLNFIPESASEQTVCQPHSSAQTKIEGSLHSRMPRLPGNQSIACVTAASYYDVSTAGLVVRALKNLGHHVEVHEGSMEEGSLIEDPSHMFKVAPSVSLVQALRDYDLVFFIGEDFSITEHSAQVLSSNEVTTYKVSPAPPGSKSKRLREAKRFGHVIYTNPTTHRLVSDSGAPNVHYLPPIPDRTYLESVTASRNEPKKSLRLTTATQFDESLAPAFVNDVNAPSRSVPLTDLKSLQLQDAAKLLRANVTFMSFRGTRNSVDPGEMFPYVVSASETTFVPRASNPEIFWQWRDTIVQVRDTNEVKAKARLLAGAPELLEIKTTQRTSIISKQSAEHYLEAIIYKTADARSRPESMSDTANFMSLAAGERSKLTFSSDDTLPKIIELTVLPPFNSSDISHVSVISPDKLCLKIPENGPVYLYLRDPSEVSFELVDKANRSFSSHQHEPMLKIRVEDLHDDVIRVSSGRGHRIGVINARELPLLNISAC